MLTCSNVLTALFDKTHATLVYLTFNATFHSFCLMFELFWYELTPLLKMFFFISPCSCSLEMCVSIMVSLWLEIL